MKNNDGDTNNNNNRVTLSLLLVLLLFVCDAFSMRQQVQQQLPVSHLSVSGFSDGAFFASQFQVAFSATVKGVGMFSGGPYYCAQGYHPQANSSCSSGVPTISVENLISDAKAFQSDGLIDDLAELADSRVYIFTGALDEVHTTVVARAASYFYSNFTSNVKLVDDVQAGHCIPSNSSISAPCNSTSFPYFNNCNYDAVVDMFSYIYNQNPNNTKIVNLSTTNGTHSFMQNSTSNDKMASAGAYYLPSACENNTCPLHVFFHSQDQGSNFKEFVDTNPINQYAEAYGVIILYPHTEDFWDWYGFTNSDYALQVGPQISLVAQIISNLTTITFK